MFKADVELLAPAGKWEVLEAVIDAGADAVYLGGKRFNMRLLRPEFNFSDEEMVAAVEYLHRRGKKLYITVNNLYLDHELRSLADYLVRLEEIGVDALIVQDLGLVGLYHKLGLSVPLHASVQMSIASSAAARFFEDKGFSRVILSKNLTLEEIRSVHESTHLGIEYFAHGDLCVSHTGQCYMSSYLKGEGPNRGRCVKPCRWSYKLHGPVEDDEPRYHLAYKDLCVFDYLPQFIESGVSSLKIEGRMRDSSYLTHLISIYRRALDGIVNGSGYQEWSQDKEKLEARRIRDFTHGNLLGQPGPDVIDRSGEREPIFISHSFLAPDLNDRIIEDFPIPNIELQAVDISVKVGDLESLAAALQAGVSRIILPGEDIRQSSFHWKDNHIEEAIRLAKDQDAQIFMETPRVVSEKDLTRMHDIIKRWASSLDGVVVNDLGSMREALNAGLTVHGGYGLNVFNQEAASFLLDQGLARVTASLELGFKDLMNQVRGLNVEVLVQGPLCGMVNDSCPVRYYDEQGLETCQARCLESGYELEDACGQRFVLRSDQQCRTYVYFPRELCNIGLLPGLISSGLRHLRIDGQFYSSQVLTEVIDTFQEALGDLLAGSWKIEGYLKNLHGICPGGLTVLHDQVHL